MNYIPLPTDLVRALQSGAPDANGMTPERATSDGVGKPCRHCLRTVPEGAKMLILAHRPFETLHPYAESGPIFLCAEPCEQGGGAVIPEIMTTSPGYLIKGYNKDDRIIYGSGAVVPRDQIEPYAKDVFKEHGAAYLHVRSASNNCYLLRIDQE